MYFTVTAIDRTEHRALPEAGGDAGDRWLIHFVAGDPTGELKAWGDLSTEDPELAARYVLGSRWSLTPA